MTSTRSVKLHTCLVVAATFLLLIPSGSRGSSPPGITDLSRTVLDAYHQGLEETLKRWPTRQATSAAELRRSSRDLLERVDDARSLVGKRGEGLDPLEGYRALRNLYEAHNRLQQASLEAQVAAYEEREEERRARVAERERSEDGEKKDIEKIFDVIFGRRGESSETDRSDTPNQDPSRVEKPVDDFQRPLVIEQRILDGVSSEVRFQIALSEGTDREARLRVWLDHVNSLLGRYLGTLYRDPSVAPLFADQYRTHLEHLVRFVRDEQRDTGDDLEDVRASLERQAQILGGVDYTRSEQAHELRGRISGVLRDLSRQ